MSTKKHPAQTGAPKKVRNAHLQHLYKAALAPDVARDQHDRQHAHGPRGPPVALPPGMPQLLDKHQVCSLLNLSFPTVWKMMIEGRFPRPRVLGGKSSKSMWLSSEVETWVAGLPVRPLKGDNANAEAVA
jgi:predicted DNA-binding transcriptional regulator AlpA